MAEERKDHKYYTRVPVKGGGNGKPKYRYFYTREEYQAYLNGNKTKEEQKKTVVKNKEPSVLDKLASLFTKPASNKSSTNNILSDGKKAVDDFLTKTAQNAKKAITEASNTLTIAANKVASETKKVAKDITDSVDKTVVKAANKAATTGKEAVDSFLSKNGNKKVKDVAVGSVVASVGMQLAATALITVGALAVKALAGVVGKVIKDIGYAIKGSKLPKKATECSKDEDMDAINPKYNTGAYAYTNNCSYCTAAYDLRQRGYDVEAMPISTSDDPTTINELASWYKDAEIETWSDVCDRQRKAGDENTSDPMATCIKYLEEDLKKHGEGSRGHLCLYWSGGGGHDVIWEIENGQVVIRDCQTNQKLKVEDYLPYCADVSYFRTDNLELNPEVFKTVQARTKKER